ncbi:MAG: hypothetical protein R3C01_14695 [Planctomycetaceae bacterium]
MTRSTPVRNRSPGHSVAVGHKRSGWVVLPEAKRGIVTAFTLAWARALGEFGPLLIFAGATRMRTEVLSTSIYLELNVGNLPGAVAVSFILIVAAGIVLTITRLLGTGILGGGTKKDIGTSGCEV